MDSNNEILDSPQMKVGELIPAKKITRSAGAGIASMLFAILLLVGLTSMDEQSALVMVVVFLIMALGLVVPIWMFIRSVALLLKKQNLEAPKRSLAIFLTLFLGFILLLLFAAFVLYMGEDRRPPF